MLLNVEIVCESIKENFPICTLGTCSVKRACNLPLIIPSLTFIMSLITMHHFLLNFSNGFCFDKCFLVFCVRSNEKFYVRVLWFSFYISPTIVFFQYKLLPYLVFNDHLLWYMCITSIISQTNLCRHFADNETTARIRCNRTWYSSGLQVLLKKQNLNFFKSMGAIYEGKAYNSFL